MINPAWLFPLTFLMDTVVGDPRSSLHPVALLGRLISRLEGLLLIEKDSAFSKRLKGALLVVVVLASVYGIVWGLIRLLAPAIPAIGLLLAEALILSFTISPRSLSQAGLQIRSRIMEGDIVSARQQVGQIVGRDTDSLDEREITRAAVETMAENLVDGIVSPLFFAWLGGVPLAFLYRGVNTLDSMIAYRNVRYGDFGMVAARTDDVFNYIPARITGVLIVIAAFFLRHDAVGSARAIWRDAAKHPSPNSGISEAGVAGALRVQLGGLNYYGGIASQRATMGFSFQELRVLHIRQTVSIIYVVTGLFVTLLTGLSFLGFQYGWLV
jgi:adenosylcobinamide-phosphate synthase